VETLRSAKDPHPFHAPDHFDAWAVGGSGRTENAKVRYCKDEYNFRYGARATGARKRSTSEPLPDRLAFRAQKDLSANTERLAVELKRPLNESERAGLSAWRIRFWQLSANARERCVFEFFAHAKGKHAASAASGGKEWDPYCWTKISEYPWWDGYSSGREKCTAKAFGFWTGLGGSTLTRIRKAVAHGSAVDDSSLDDRRGYLSIATLDALAWLEDKIATLGQFSPVHKRVYLPCGMYKDYYEDYAGSCAQTNVRPLSYPRWRLIWLKYHSNCHVLRRPPWKKCETCAMLKFLEHRSPERVCHRSGGGGGAWSTLTHLFAREPLPANGKSWAADSGTLYSQALRGSGAGSRACEACGEAQRAAVVHGGGPLSAQQVYADFASPASSGCPAHPSQASEPAR